MDSFLLEKLNKYCEHIVAGNVHLQIQSKDKKGKYEADVIAEENCKRNKEKKLKKEISGEKHAPVLDEYSYAKNDENSVGEKMQKMKKKKNITECTPLSDELSNVRKDKYSCGNEIKKKKKNQKCNTEPYSLSEVAEHKKDLKIVDGEKYTSDGFKVVSFIPDDDSDISDAFESDVDLENWSSPTAQDRKNTSNSVSSQNEAKVTEDGFKIRTEIPADDSDISDAFTDTEEEGFITADELLAKKKKLTLQRPLKKQFLKIMDDFGIDNTSLVKTPKEEENKSKKSKRSQNLTLAAQKRHQEEVVIYDYSKKRGLPKKEEEEEQTNAEGNTEDSVPEMVKKEEEKSIRRLKFDVIKFGMEGFQRPKKAEQRTKIAIKLGAKPPKNKPMNYAKLMEKRKAEMVQERIERMERKKDGLPVKKKQKRIARDINKVVRLNPVMGFEKNGVQILPKRDIRKMQK